MKGGKTDFAYYVDRIDHLFTRDFEQTLKSVEKIVKKCKLRSLRFLLASFSFLVQ